MINKQENFRQIYIYYSWIILKGVLLELGKDYWSFEKGQTVIEVVDPVDREEK